MPGQRFSPPPGLGPATSVYAEDAAGCCRKCAELWDPVAARAARNAKRGKLDIEYLIDADSPGSGFCAAWTYERKNQRCQLGWGKVLHSPATALTHESGVRISECPKCGDGLLPDNDRPHE